MSISYHVMTILSNFISGTQNQVFRFQISEWVNVNKIVQRVSHNIQQEDFYAVKAVI